MDVFVWFFYVCNTPLSGVDLGFIKGGGGGGGGGLTQGTNLLGRGMQSMLELGESGGMPPGKVWKIDAKILQFGDIST